MGSQIGPKEKLKGTLASLVYRTGQVALGKPSSLLWVKDQESGRSHLDFPYHPSPVWTVFPQYLVFPLEKACAFPFGSPVGCS